MGWQPVRPKQEAFVIGALHRTPSIHRYNTGILGGKECRYIEICLFLCVSFFGVANQTCLNYASFVT